MGRCHVADSTPDDGSHALTEEGQGHDDDDGIERVEIISRHDGHRTEETADDGQFSGF